MYSAPDNNPLSTASAAAEGCIWDGEEHQDREPTATAPQASNESTAGTASTIQRTGATRIAYTIIVEDHTTNKEFIFVARTTADRILNIETTHNGPTFNVQSPTYVAR
jgi:hypothetical protein